MFTFNKQPDSSASSSAQREKLPLLLKTIRKQVQATDTNMLEEMEKGGVVAAKATFRRDQLSGGDSWVKVCGRAGLASRPDGRHRPSLCKLVRRVVCLAETAAPAGGWEQRSER